ncbi:MAG: HAD family hydrolase [Defluviitaleaceae bacterium]|nr:HAD family hydrolase [Defluviitaleaceae bacterium]
MRAKTLYLSDLDGTLLGSNQRVSEYTAKIVNSFVEGGGCFSYATARSAVTASEVTKGLNTEFPVICYNGAFIFGNKSKEILLEHYFDRAEVDFIADTLAQHNVVPMVFAFIDGVERFSFIERDVSEGMRRFLDSRQNDPRRREVHSADKLYDGKVFLVNRIDNEGRLAPINEVFKGDKRIHCIYQKEIYFDAQWCELLPAKATKATAALELKKMLGCDRLVVFGDAENDISLFSVADESYAMANAIPVLKEMATGVIDGNDDDGVARWLEKNVM